MATFRRPDPRLRGPLSPACHYNHEHIHRFPLLLPHILPHSFKVLLRKSWIWRIKSNTASIFFGNQLETQSIALPKTKGKMLNMFMSLPLLWPTLERTLQVGKYTRGSGIWSQETDQADLSWEWLDHTISLGPFPYHLMTPLPLTNKNTAFGKRRKITS